MALFLSGNIHQGVDIFSVHSRGKQCAFIALSAIVTAQNIPLVQWSKTTIYNILVQEDQMYLKALYNGFIIQDEFLSIDKLPKHVSVSFCGRKTSMIATISNSNDLPFVIDSIEAQNNCDLLVVVAQNNCDLPVVVAQNNCDLPVVVAQNNCDVPVVVAQNNCDVPVVVAQNNGDVPVVVAQNNGYLPVVIELSEPKEKI